MVWVGGGGGVVQQQWTCISKTMLISCNEYLPRYLLSAPPWSSNRLPPLHIRCAHHVIRASMEAMTATKMPAVTTLDTLPIPCFAANASLAMLAMAISVEKTQIWMDGPMLTWSAWRMPPITAKRYVVAKEQGKRAVLFCKNTEQEITLLSQITCRLFYFLMV